MKNIIQVFGSLDAGGAESRMMDVFRAIDRSKYNFIFVSLDTSDGQVYEREIVELGGEIFKIASPRQIGAIAHLRQLTALFKRLNKEGKADAVHSHTSYHSGLVLMGAKIARIPIRIAHARTTSSISSGLASKMMMTVGKTLIKQFATNRFAINPEAARALFGSATRVEIIPNAIPLTRYENDSVSDLFTNISPQDTVLCHVGRFQPMKNHEFLIDLFKDFYSRHTDSWLMLVGDGPLKSAMQEKVKSLGIEGRVIFAGVRRDVPQILNRANVFILPSWFEGLPGVVLEAQASGVSSVVSDTIPQSVDMGMNLVDFVSLGKSNKEWIQALEKALVQPRPAFEDRYAAFENKGFTIEHEIKMLTSFYENSNDNNDNI